MKKTLFFFAFTFLFYLSNSQITYDLTNNNNLSEINAISSMGNIDDQISMSSDPILTLDINNNGILDYVVSKHALGEVYIMLDYPNFNNSLYTPQIDSDVVLINGAMNLGVSFDKGDFNNDGIDDIILGASLENGDGEAFVIFGSTNFLSIGTYDIFNISDVNIQFSGFSGNPDRFGDQVKLADINNDNYDDAIISAPVSWYTSDGSGRGSIYILYGSSNPQSTIQARTSADVIIEGYDAFDHIGKYLATGDFDNDGIIDLAFTSPHWPGAGLNGQRGKVWILYGESNLLDFYDSSLTYSNLSSFAGNAQNDEMAYVETGDFNGDNIADLIVSAGKYDEPNIVFPSSNNFGTLYVLYGPIGREEYLLDIETFPNIKQVFPNSYNIPMNEIYMYIDANFGQSIALFDVNDDNIDDMLVGMVGYSKWPSTGSQTGEGGAMIIFGSNNTSNTIYADGGDVLFLANIPSGIGFYNISFGRSVSFVETNDNKLLAAIADNERNSIYLFEMSNTSSYDEPSNMIQEKNLITVDLLGREVNNKHGLQVEIYDDGSVEKKYILK